MSEATRRTASRGTLRSLLAAAALALTLCPRTAWARAGARGSLFVGPAFLRLQPARRMSLPGLDDASGEGWLLARAGLPQTPRWSFARAFPDAGHGQAKETSVDAFTRLAGKFIGTQDIVALGLLRVRFEVILK